MGKYETEISATPGGREVVITRMFDATPDKLYKAYTDKDLVMKWMGPRALEGQVDNWDLRPGGEWAFSNTDPAGNKYQFHGFFHLLKENERIVQTFEFLGMPGHVSMQVIDLQEQDGKTKLTSTAVFHTPQDRDGMLQSGMEKGVVEGNERLDELLLSI